MLYITAARERGSAGLLLRVWVHEILPLPVGTLEVVFGLQESLCECFFRGDVLQEELSFSALGGTKEIILDDFHRQSQAVDEEVVWCMSGLNLY